MPAPTISIVLTRSERRRSGEFWSEMSRLLEEQGVSLKIEDADGMEAPPIDRPRSDSRGSGDGSKANAAMEVLPAVISILDEAGGAAGGLALVLNAAKALRAKRKRPTRSFEFIEVRDKNGEPVYLLDIGDGKFERIWETKAVPE